MNRISKSDTSIAKKYQQGDDCTISLLNNVIELLTQRSPTGCKQSDCLHDALVQSRCWSPFGAVNLKATAHKACGKEGNSVQIDKGRCNKAPLQRRYTWRSKQCPTLADQRL